MGLLLDHAQEDDQNIDRPFFEGHVSTKDKGVHQNDLFFCSIVSLSKHVHYTSKLNRSVGIILKKERGLKNSDKAFSFQHTMNLARPLRQPPNIPALFFSSPVQD